MRSFMNITIKLLQYHSHDHNHDKLFEHMQVINEVATPAATPVFEREQPAVKMPGVPR